MAKLVKTYENDIEKIELTFRGEVFDYSMIPNDYGRKGDKPGFDNQIACKYPDLVDEEDVLELLDSLSFEDDSDDILDILDQLGGWEQEV